MKSSVDIIWDRMFGANALDLSLHKPRLELNAEEKKAGKTAKNTRAKMEATELAGLCSNRVKEMLASILILDFELALIQIKYLEYSPQALCLEMGHCGRVSKYACSKASALYQTWRTQPSLSNQAYAPP